ncbi:MAG: alkaline phosphatase family protein [Clostridia bacterium]|nr:alkaline phosphatase family protein [Clostridia bacterium]
MINQTSLDTLCASLCYAMGIDAPSSAAKPNPLLCDYIDKTLKDEKADRIFMYNPDAIAQWVYEKYSQIFEQITTQIDIEVPFCTVMPSVTPVCFGTMYTGVQPEIHGIQSYVKPVITIDTIFDALISSGKKPVIVSTANDSMSKIFLERKMDYFIYDTISEVNQKALELIKQDEYDFIAVYNGNYDTVMHKFGPESPEALDELRDNVTSFDMFCKEIAKCWKKHNSLLGFAMDHGCHEIDGGCGSHGLAMEEDLNIMHLYKTIKAKK